MASKSREADVVRMRWILGGLSRETRSYPAAFYPTRGRSLAPLRLALASAELAVNPVEGPAVGPRGLDVVLLLAALETVG